MDATLELTHERVDDVPLLLAFLIRLRLPEVLDRHLPPCILKGGRRMNSHSKGTRGGRPSPLRSEQAVDELGSPPRHSRRPQARTVDRPPGPHSKDGHRRTTSPPTESHA